MACLYANRYYEVLVDCRPFLLEKAEKDIKEGEGRSYLASELHRAGIISGEEFDTIQERRDMTPKQKADNLVRWMEKKVELYPDSYDCVIKIFRKKPSIFEDLVPTLERKLNENDDNVVFENYDAISQDTFVSNQSAEDEYDYYVKLKCKCKKCMIEKYLEGEDCSRKCTSWLTLKDQKPTASKLSSNRYMTYRTFKSLNKKLAADMNAQYQNLLSTTVTDLEKQYPLEYVKKELHNLINPTGSRYSSYSSVYKIRTVYLKEVKTYSALKNFLDEELCCWFNIAAISHLRKNLLLQDQVDRITIEYKEHKTDYIKRSCILHKLCDNKKQLTCTKIICEFSGTDFRKINKTQILSLKNEIVKFICVSEFKMEVCETNGKLSFIKLYQSARLIEAQHQHSKSKEQPTTNEGEPSIFHPSTLSVETQHHTSSQRCCKVC